MPGLSPDDELYRPSEVAALFGVTTTTVALWVRTGRLKACVRTPGGHRRFRRADVRAFRPGPVRGETASADDRSRNGPDTA